MVRPPPQRVPQLPHAERVAKEGVPAPHYRPELRQGEGKRHRKPAVQILSANYKKGDNTISLFSPFMAHSSTG